MISYRIVFCHDEGCAINPGCVPIFTASTRYL